MSLVNVWNEWDPLEEVIVGRATHARIARPDRGLFAVEYREYGTPNRIPSGLYPDRIIQETEEELERLVEAFEGLGVTVRRPDVFDHSRMVCTSDWQTDGQYNYCPRDLFVAAGNWLIESPMTLRCRQFEPLSYKPILLNYLRPGTRWVSAPKPRLSDAIYNIDGPIALNDHEPVFDAANVLRMGRDLLYLVSDSGNACGAAWLQTVLGPDFKVHPIAGLYNGSHIDTSITLVREGLVVVSAERVNPVNLPAIFKDWEVIYLDEVIDIGFTETCYASKWIGINFMMARPDLAIVDGVQRPLIRELERRGVDVIPLRLRHARTLGGGFHCVTLDVRRRSPGGAS